MRKYFGRFIEIVGDLRNYRERKREEVSQRNLEKNSRDYFLDCRASAVIENQPRILLRVSNLPEAFLR